MPHDQAALAESWRVMLHDGTVGQLVGRWLAPALVAAVQLNVALEFNAGGDGRSKGMMPVGGSEAVVLEVGLEAAGALLVLLGAKRPGWKGKMERRKDLVRVALEKGVPGGVQGRITLPGAARDEARGRQAIWRAIGRICAA